MLSAATQALPSTAENPKSTPSEAVPEGATNADDGANSTEHSATELSAGSGQGAPEPTAPPNSPPAAVSGYPNPSPYGRSAYVAHGGSLSGPGPDFTQVQAMGGMGYAPYTPYAGPYPLAHGGGGHHARHGSLVGSFHGGSGMFMGKLMGGVAMLAIMGAMSMGFLWQMEKVKVERLRTDLVAAQDRSAAQAKVITDQAAQLKETIARAEAADRVRREINDKFARAVKERDDIQEKYNSYRTRLSSAMKKKPGLVENRANRATERVVNSFAEATCRIDCTPPGAPKVDPKKGADKKGAKTERKPEPDKNKDQPTETSGDTSKIDNAASGSK